MSASWPKPYQLARAQLANGTTRSFVLCTACGKAISRKELSSHLAEPEHASDTTCERARRANFAMLAKNTDPPLGQLSEALANHQAPLPALEITDGFGCSECQWAGSSDDVARRHVREKHHEQGTLVACRVQRLSKGGLCSHFIVADPGEPSLSLSCGDGASRAELCPASRSKREERPSRSSRRASLSHRSRRTACASAGAQGRRDAPQRRADPRTSTPACA